MQAASGQLVDRLAPRAPFISVVTVSLNAAATIEDTIASVCLQQTNFAVEHVCVDGGSVDTTRAIIDRWAERSGQITRIYEPDTGIFDAMNKGLRAAKGEYVLFLNADDFLVAPNTLAVVAAGLLAGATDNPDLIVGNVSMGKLGSRGVWRHRRVPKLLAWLRGFGLYPLHQAQFTKRRLLDSIGGFNTALRIASDVIQYYELEKKFRPSLRFIDSDVAFMRDGGAANAGPGGRYLATMELYKHLSSTYSYPRAVGMVIIKTLQSLFAVRLGYCPHSRWFASAIEHQRVTDPQYRHQGALIDK